jgi:hypothetical protein
MKAANDSSQCMGKALLARVHMWVKIPSLLESFIGRTSSGAPV